MSSNNSIGFVPGIALIMSAVALLLILLGHVGDVGTDDLAIQVNAVNSDLKALSEKVGDIPARVATLESWKSTELNGNALDKAKLYLNEHVSKNPSDAKALDALKVLNGELVAAPPKPAGPEKKEPAPEKD